MARARLARKASVSRNIKDKFMESRNRFPNPTTEENSPKAHLWTCPLCTGQFMKGWKRHMHVQRCNAHLHNPTLEQTESFAEATAPVHAKEHEKDQAPLEQTESLAEDTTTEHEKEHTEDDQRPLQQTESSAEETATELADMDDRTPCNQYNARHMVITKKDMEILQFLECNDQGVGTSREQKQGVLDYVKSFDTARTNLLPKRITTCYNRMDKVTIIVVFVSHAPIVLACTNFITSL